MNSHAPVKQQSPIALCLGGAWQMLFSAGRNLTNVADNRFSYFLSLYRTF